MEHFPTLGESEDLDEREDLKTLHKMVELEARAYATGQKNLCGSLEGSLNSLNKLEGELSALKDDLVETSDQYLKQEKEHLEFLSSGLDLSQKDLFKVVCDGKLMDEEEFPTTGGVSLTDHKVT